MRGTLISATTLAFLLISACTLSMSPLQKGKYYLERGNYPRAVKAFEKATNEDGDIYYYVDSYAYLGDAYSGSGQPNNALSVYRNAMQIIHLRLREISARRYEVRRELNFKSNEHARILQEEDMRLADEEWKLRERGDDIEKKIGAVMEIM